MLKEMPSQTSVTTTTIIIIIIINICLIINNKKWPEWIHLYYHLNSVYDARS